MKDNICISYFLISLFLMSCSLTRGQNQEDYKSFNCCSDTLKREKYDRKIVLAEFIATLNKLVPQWGLDKKGFYVTESCHLSGSFIWDLTDTSIKESRSNDKCIEFKEGHIYHFSPMRKTYSYSSIAILKEGKVKIFKAVNCPEKGDKLEDVIQYIKDSLPSSIVNEELINRVKGFRKYGVYLQIDEQTEFRCNLN